MNPVKLICIIATLAVFGCGNETGTITSNLVNLRSGPSTDSTVVTMLNANDKVRIIEKQVMTVDQGSQTVIGKAGILNKQANIYVNNRPYPMNNAKAVKIIGVNSGSYLVEFEADGTQKAVGYVAIADVEILKMNTWYKVRTGNGQEGWVFERFIVKN